MQKHLLLKKTQNLIMYVLALFWWILKLITSNMAHFSGQFSYFLTVIIRSIETRSMYMQYIQGI